MYQLISGAPDKLIIDDTHPLANALGQLLGLAALPAELTLPALTAEGVFEINFPDPSPIVALAGLSLQARRMRLDVVNDGYLQIDVRIAFPAPLTGLVLDGVVTVQPSLWRIAAQVTRSSVFEIASGAQLSLPAGLSLAASVGDPGAQWSLLAGAVPMLLRLPGGRALCTRMDLGPAGFSLRGALDLAPLAGLRLSADDMALSVSDTGTLELVSQPVARLALTLGDWSAEATAESIFLQIIDGSVTRFDVTTAAFSGAVNPVGPFAASGALHYRAVAEIPVDPPVQGEELVLEFASLSLAMPLGDLLPQGSSTLHVWPSVDSFRLSGALSGEVPVIGAIGPVSGRIEKLGTLISGAIEGVSIPALSLGPDLPQLAIGPLDISASFDRVLSGQVSDVSGDTLAGQAVRVLDAQGTELHATVCDDQGRFEIVAVDAQASDIEFPGRRIARVGAQDESGGSSVGDYALVSFAANAIVPIVIPPTFPVLSSSVISAALSWQRGAGIDLSFPAGLPPLDIGPLAINVSQVSGHYENEAAGIVATLAVDAGLEVRLPLLEGAFSASGTGNLAWQSHGPRIFELLDVTVAVPAGIPLLGGQTISGARASISQTGPGQTAAFEVALTLPAAFVPTPFPGIDVVADQPALRLWRAPGEDWPSVSLDSGSVQLNLPFLSLALTEASLSEDAWSVSGRGTIDVGFATVDESDVTIAVNQAGWDAQFNATGGTISVLDPPQSIASASVAIRHRADEDSLRIGMTGLRFGPLDLTLDGELVVHAHANGDLEAWIEAQVDWQDLDLGNAPGLSWPEGFPAVPPSGTASLRIEWEDVGGTQVFRLRALGRSDTIAELWSFLPPNLVPVPEQIDIEIAVALTDGDLSNASVSATLAIALPDLSALPGAELVRLYSNDPEGLVRGTLAAELVADDNGSLLPSVRCQLSSELGFDLFIPGIAEERPPLSCNVKTIEFDVSPGAQRFSAAADFVLLAPEPPPFVPFGAQLHGLLTQVGLDEIRGTIAIDVGIAANGKLGVSALGTFDDLGLSVDVFDMLGGLSSGLGIGGGEAEQDVDLDLDVGFTLAQIGFRFGPPLAGSAAVGSDDETIAFMIAFALTFGDAEAVVRMSLSDRQLALAFDELRIPITMPLWPLLPSDMDGLDAPADWQGAIAALQSQYDAMPEPVSGGDRALRVARTQVQQRLQLLKAVRIYHDRIDADDAAEEAQKQANYRSHVQWVSEHLRQVTGMFQTESDYAIKLVDTGFFFPFSNPSNVRVEGTATLSTITGFAPDDPLEALEGVEFGLGLSADRIFFQLRTNGAIPLPSFGRYPGGEIDISQFSVGYGFTRNSLAVNIAGQLRVPDQLVEDADTSRRIGAGIRLPTHARGGFRLDIIPVSIGAIDFVVPLLEFEADLRTPGSPPLLDARDCLPYWDGLQVHIPGVFRADLKHVAFAPFFTMIPAPNFRQDWDIEFGNEANGLRLIVNDMLSIIGLSTTNAMPIPVPYLASATEPYFDNLCASLRFAGFGITFDIERPFPTFSPLALFEVLALIADPMTPVAHEGHLANTARVSLKHARIALPEALRPLFPLTEVLDKELNITFNLADLITACQIVGAAIDETITFLNDSATTISQRVESLQEVPPDFSPGDILDLLPIDLRKLRLHASLGGFEARAVILLMTRKEALRALQERDRPPRATPAATSIAFLPGEGAPPGATADVRLDWQIGNGNRRHTERDEPSANPFRGIEFAAFTRQDLEAVSGDGSGNSVVVATHVKLPFGQRVRFLGFLWEDASFALLSLADIDLRLAVAGIELPLPFHASGRLSLKGRGKRGGSFAAVTATGSVAWSVIPAVLSINLGAKKNPVLLAFHPDGGFHVQGDGTVTLFSGAAHIHGHCEIDESHCLLRGRLQYSIGAVIRLDLEVSGRAGPGKQFLFAGGGKLAVLGREMLDVAATIDEAGAQVRGSLSTRKWRIGAVRFPCHIDLALQGRIDISQREAPTFELQGEGSLGLPQLKLDLKGRCTMSADNGQVVVRQEGALEWLGREWLRGWVELGSSAIEVGGAVRFALPLTPPNAGSIDLARLFLTIDLDAWLRFSPSAALGTWHLHGDWSLAAVTADGRQSMPLASQAFNTGMSSSFEHLLLSINGDFSLFPFGELKLTLPDFDDITISTPVKKDSLRWGNIHGNRAVSWKGKTIQFLGNAFPIINNGNLSADETQGVLPNSWSLNIPAGSEQSLNSFFSGALGLKLVWSQGEIRVRVENLDSGQSVDVPLLP